MCLLKEFELFWVDNSIPFGKFQVELDMSVGARTHSETLTYCFGQFLHVHHLCSTLVRPSKQSDIIYQGFGEHPFILERPQVKSGWPLVSFTDLLLLKVLQKTHMRKARGFPIECLVDD